MSNLKEIISLQGLSSLQRPRFSPGLLLEDEDLTASVDYTRNMMRLLFRSLFGCGVICGLEVRAALTCNHSKLKVAVGGGLALDCMGNPIHIPNEQTVTYDPDCKPLPPFVWVTACYVEKCCRPRDVSCSSDDDSHVVFTRTYDGFEIKLYDQRPDCACECKDKDPPPPKATHGPCCQDGDDAAAAAKDAKMEDTQRTAEAVNQPPPNPCYDDHNKGVCACDCGCNCVVIGKIDTSFNAQNT